MQKETWILTSEELENKFWIKKTEYENGHIDNLLHFMKENNIELLDEEGVIYSFASRIASEGNFIFNFEDNMLLCFIPIKITDFQYEFLMKSETIKMLRKFQLHAFSYHEYEGEIFTTNIEPSIYNEEPSSINKFYKEIKSKYKKAKEKIKR